MEPTDFSLGREKVKCVDCGFEDLMANMPELNDPGWVCTSCLGQEK